MALLARHCSVCSSCVCVQEVSFKFPPSLFAEFALIPCPLLSFACFTQVCTNAFWCECLACTGLFYERLLDGRIDGNFYTLPRSYLYLLLSSLRYALTICVCVCARGSRGHDVFGALDIIAIPASTGRMKPISTSPPPLACDCS